MDLGRARDGGGTEGTCGLSAITTERKSGNRNQPPGIRKYKKKEGVDGGAQGDRSFNERANQPEQELRR